MSGKITDDIIMKVGHGVVRIPRNAEGMERTVLPYTKKRSGKKSDPIEKKQISDEASSVPCCNDKKGCNC